MTENNTPTKGELKYVPITMIKENPVALRPADTESESFQNLLSSVKTHGILKPILLRPIKLEDNTDAYGLADGLQRFTAAKLAGLTEIPAMILNYTDADVLDAQIIANVQKIETKPVEYSKQLLRILGQKPTMTLSELATRLSKSPQWLEQRLYLTGLTVELACLVDDNKISLPNAYVLAKLPVEEQVQYTEEAQTSPSVAFVAKLNNRIKEIREAKRQGRIANPPTFTPIARLQKLSDIKEEIDSPMVAASLIAQVNVTTLPDAFRLALQWALKLDPLSIASAKAQFEQEQKDQDVARAKRDEDKKKRILERAEKEKKDAEAKLAELHI